VEESSEEESEEVLRKISMFQQCVVSDIFHVSLVNVAWQFIFLTFLSCYKQEVAGTESDEASSDEEILPAAKATNVKAINGKPSNGKAADSDDEDDSEDDEVNFI